MQQSHSKTNSIYKSTYRPNGTEDSKVDTDSVEEDICNVSK